MSWVFFLETLVAWIGGLVPSFKMSFQAEEVEGGSKEVIAFWESKNDEGEYLVLVGRHHSLL